ncbi:MAG: hypothetical protein AAGU14_00070 [Eubacteriaceae bacterium]
MKKGDFLINKINCIYQIVGYWGTDVVLSSENESDDQVLIYTISELEEMIFEGYFRKLFKTGVNING